LNDIVSAHAGESADPAPGEEATASSALAHDIVQMRGTEGMLVQGRGLGRVTWVEDGVRYDLMGETASADQVLALAKAL